VLKNKNVSITLEHADKRLDVLPNLQANLNATKTKPAYMMTPRKIVVLNHHQHAILWLKINALLVELIANFIQNRRSVIRNKQLVQLIQ